MGFTNADPIELAPPEVGTESLKDQLENVSLPMKGLDWVYEQIRGKSLYDELILPLTGDFNRIRANGEAWEKAGSEGLERMSDNLTKAEEKLVNEHWTAGDAASAFTQHIEVVWFAALYGSAQVCKWVKKGFDVLADKAIAVGQKAAEWLEELVELVVQLASKMVPGGGWISAGWDLITGELFEKVDRVIALAEAIIGLQDTIEKIVNAAKAYIEGAQTIADAVKMIPDISSGNDAVAAARKFGEGKQQVEEARTQMQEGTAELDQHLTTIKDTKLE